MRFCSLLSPYSVPWWTTSAVSGNALYDRQFDAPPLTVPASGGGAYVTTINAVTGDEILVARFSTFRIEGPED